MDTGVAGPNALGDRQTRRSFLAYIGMAFAVLAFGIGAFCLVAGALIDANGNAKPGVPDLLVVALLLMALFGTPWAILWLLHCLRIWWVLARHPWERVESSYDALAGGRQPVIAIAPQGKKTDLTPIAFRWRWRRFATEELLFAGRPGRGGVIATTDRRTIVWAGRSPVTRFYRW